MMITPYILTGSAPELLICNCSSFSQGVKKPRHFLGVLLSAKIIKELELKVVHETDYEFTLHGMTKVWVLSQSHLILHTWPEYQAVHIDLMTCSDKINKDKLEKVLAGVNAKEVEITELVY